METEALCEVCGESSGEMVCQACEPDGWRQCPGCGLARTTMKGCAECSTSDHHRECQCPRCLEEWRERAGEEVRRQEDAEHDEREGEGRWTP